MALTFMIGACDMLVGHVLVGLQHAFAGIPRWNFGNVVGEYTNQLADGSFSALVHPDEWREDEAIVIEMHRHNTPLSLDTRPVDLDSDERDLVVRQSLEEFSFDALSFPCEREGHTIKLVCGMQLVPQMLALRDPDLFKKDPSLMDVSEYRSLIGVCQGFFRFQPLLAARDRAKKERLWEQEHSS